MEALARERARFQQRTRARAKSISRLTSRERLEGKSPASPSSRSRRRSSTKRVKVALKSSKKAVGETTVNQGKVKNTTVKKKKKKVTRRHSRSLSRSKTHAAGSLLTPVKAPTRSRTKQQAQPTQQQQQQRQQRQQQPSQARSRRHTLTSTNSNNSTPNKSLSRLRETSKSAKAAAREYVEKRLAQVQQRRSSLPLTSRALASTMLGTSTSSLASTTSSSLSSSSSSALSASRRTLVRSRSHVLLGGARADGRAPALGNRRISSSITAANIEHALELERSKLQERPHPHRHTSAPQMLGSSSSRPGPDESFEVAARYFSRKVVRLDVSVVDSMNVQGQYAEVDALALLVPDTETRTAESLAEYFGTAFCVDTDMKLLRAIFRWMCHSISRTGPTPAKLRKGGVGQSLSSASSMTFGDKPLRRSSTADSDSDSDLEPAEGNPMVRYNGDGSDSEDDDDVVITSYAQDVLDDRRGDALGIACLFQAIAEAAGFDTLRISGIGRQAGTFDPSAPPDWVNHHWNAVYVAGQWHLFDVTWSAGVWVEKFHRVFADAFFNTVPESFVLNHFPLQAHTFGKPFLLDGLRSHTQLQFLRRSIDKREFNASLLPTRDYFSMQVLASKPLTHVLSLREPRVQFELTTPNDLDMHLHIERLGARKSHRTALDQAAVSRLGSLVSVMQLSSRTPSSPPSGSTLQVSSADQGHNLQRSSSSPEFENLRRCWVAQHFPINHSSNGQRVTLHAILPKNGTYEVLVTARRKSSEMMLYHPVLRFQVRTTTGLFDIPNERRLYIGFVTPVVVLGDEDHTFASKFTLLEPLTGYFELNLPTAVAFSAPKDTAGMVAVSNGKWLLLERTRGNIYGKVMFRGVIVMTDFPELLIFYRRKGRNAWKLHSQYAHARAMSAMIEELPGAYSLDQEQHLLPSDGEVLDASSAYNSPLGTLPSSSSTDAIDTSHRYIKSGPVGNDRRRSTRGDHAFDNDPEVQRRRRALASYSSHRNSLRNLLLQDDFQRSKFDPQTPKAAHGLRRSSIAKDLEVIGSLVRTATKVEAEQEEDSDITPEQAAALQAQLEAEAEAEKQALLAQKREELSGRFLLDIYGRCFQVGLRIGAVKMGRHAYSIELTAPKDVIIRGSIKAGFGSVGSNLPTGSLVIQKQTTHTESEQEKKKRKQLLQKLKRKQLQKRLSRRGSSSSSRRSSTSSIRGPASPPPRTPSPSTPDGAILPAITSSRARGDDNTWLVTVKVAPGDYSLFFYVSTTGPDGIFRFAFCHYFSWRVEY